MRLRIRICYGSTLKLDVQVKLSYPVLLALIGVAAGWPVADILNNILSRLP